MVTLVMPTTLKKTPEEVELGDCDSVTVSECRCRGVTASQSPNAGAGV